MFLHGSILSYPAAGRQLPKARQRHPAGVACMKHTGQWIEFAVYFWAAASALAWYRASIFSDTFGGRRKIRTATEITTPKRAAM